VSLFLLIRHGETPHTGSRLSGRSPGVHLNERGRQQAASLPARLGPVAPQILCSSPLERCCETAQPLAEYFDLPLRRLDDLQELDYGHWQGSHFADLADDSYWHRYNRLRGTSRIPGGELLLEVQARMMRALEALHREAPEGRIALCSHSDAIKALLLLLLGIPLDFVNRLALAPASISALSFGAGEPQLHCLNVTARLDEALGMS